MSKQVSASGQASRGKARGERIEADALQSLASVLQYTVSLSDPVVFCSLLASSEFVMPDAASSSLALVAYLALFITVGLLFLLVNLVLGRFVRPNNPEATKLETYECGEPAIGRGYVQFDLRFYVVALVFLIFDVEVAFFFPWATVFGKATELAVTGPGHEVVQRVGDDVQLTPMATGVYRELGVRAPTVPMSIPESLRGAIDPSADPLVRSSEIIQKGSRQLAFLTLVDIGVFFVVLMIGFAYVWNRGDLEWVRTVQTEAGSAVPARVASSTELDLEQALSRGHQSERSGALS